MSRAVSNIAIKLACIALIAGSAWGQGVPILPTTNSSVIRHTPTPISSPFIRVIDTDEDVSWVDVRSITGISMTPDRSYRYGKSWYSSQQDGDEPDELRERWVVAFVGTGIEARYSTRQEAASAVNRVLTTARDRQWQ